MGEAKRRGTFEERKEAAEKRPQRNTASDPKPVRKMSDQQRTALLLAAVLGLTERR